MGGFKKDASGSEGRDTFAYAWVSSPLKIVAGYIQKMHGASSLFSLTTGKWSEATSTGKIKPSWCLSIFPLPISQIFLLELSLCTEHPIQSKGIQRSNLLIMLNVAAGGVYSVLRWNSGGTANKDGNSNSTLRDNKCIILLQQGEGEQERERFIILYL